MKKIKSLVWRLLFVAQQVLLNSADFLFRLVVSHEGRISWVVGVDETAANVHYISQALPNSFSISIGTNRYYGFQYNQTAPSGKLSNLLFRIFCAPILLAYLLNRSDGFFYIGNTRFLISRFDEGEYELKYLKGRSKRIVLFYCGSDIRSPKLALEQSRIHGNEVFVSYLGPNFLTEEFEQTLKRRASASEKYAECIFTASVDQASYFTKKTTPFMYFYPDNLFHYNENKFRQIGAPKIIHAPSNPMIKGTQLVRAAISRLRREGFKFTYVELIGVPNQVVLEELRSAHIALNEFYAFVPGLFGVEAMAAHCALLTAADEDIEPDLPRGSNNAWLVTRTYEIYDHLKLLLGNPELMKRYADSGFEWASRYAAQSQSSQRLREILSRSNSSAVKC